MKSPLSLILSEKGHMVHTIDTRTNVQDAADRMSQLNIGALIVSEDAVILGIVTERDLMTKVLASGRDAQTTFVGDIMTPAPYTVAIDITVEAAMRVMTEKRIRHLPVVDKGCLIGIISIGDVTRWAIRNQEAQISDLMRYISGAHS